MLLQEESHLMQTNAVLSGAGTLHGERPSREPVVDGLGRLPFLGFRWIDQHGDMEISVTDVSQYASGDGSRTHIGLRLYYAAGKL